MTNAPSVPAAIRVRDIRLNNLSMDDALNAIHGALARQVPTRIAFVNADCVNIAARVPSYLQDLQAMDWVFADGVGMRLAGQWLKQPVRANVNGTDLFPRLCEQLAQDGHRLYLLGGAEGAAAGAAAWAQQHHPGLQIAGTQHGFISDDALPAALQALRESQADVLLVGLGAPRQERWIQTHAAHTGATVVVGVGGLFDYYSGNVARAPQWMRRSGLEWVWRLMQEPRRLFYRYVVGNWVFLARIAMDSLRQRWTKGRR